MRFYFRFFRGFREQEEPVLFSLDNYNCDKEFRGSQAKTIRLAETIRLINIRIVIILVSNTHRQNYKNSRGSITNNTSSLKINTKLNIGFLLRRYTKEYNNQEITRKRKGI
jgi:hypothetical protein